MASIHLEPFERALVVESPHESLDRLLAREGVRVERLDSVTDTGALIDALRRTRAQVLFKRSRVEVTRELLEACPDLRTVQLCCIGDDSVDKQACADHGVLVFNDPVSNGRSVVELAIGHLIALSRRLFDTSEAMRRHGWNKSANGRTEVLGKRLGIVGLGNIGRQVARLAEALGMEVGFYDNRLVARTIGEECGWRGFDTLEELFRSSDMVTVHVSAHDALGHDNAGLLDRVLHLLAADRPAGAPRVFLNLARGNVHSADALLGAVREGAIRYAAVDVYPEEPAPGARQWINPYADEPRIICTPHIGAATEEAQPRIARRVAATQLDHFRFGTMRDCVFAPRAKVDVSDRARGRVVLAVVHSVSRGTKKAIDDAVYEAEASNLGSMHLDFEVGIAYDVSVLDRPLDRAQLERIVHRAHELSGDPDAVRSIRQILVPPRD